MLTSHLYICRDGTTYLPRLFRLSMRTALCEGGHHLRQSPPFALLLLRARGRRRRSSSRSTFRSNHATDINSVVCLRVVFMRRPSSLTLYVQVAQKEPAVLQVVPLSRRRHCTASWRGFSVRCAPVVCTPASASCCRSLRDVLASLTTVTPLPSVCPQMFTAYNMLASARDTYKRVLEKVRMVAW